MTSMKNNSERVSIFSFRKGGARSELTLFVVLVLAYTIIAGVYLTPKGLNGWPEILASIVGHVSTFIPVAIVLVLTYEIVGVYTMLLWDLYKEERSRQRQEREAALQQVRSRAEEAEKRINLWEAWNARRVEAERQNANFAEPPPSESDK